MLTTFPLVPAPVEPGLPHPDSGDPGAGFLFRTILKTLGFPLTPQPVDEGVTPVPLVAGSADSASVDGQGPADAALMAEGEALSAGDSPDWTVLETAPAVALSEGLVDASAWPGADGGASTPDRALPLAEAPVARRSPDYALSQVMLESRLTPSLPAPVRGAAPPVPAPPVAMPAAQVAVPWAGTAPDAVLAEAPGADVAGPPAGAVPAAPRQELRSAAAEPPPAAPSLSLSASAIAPAAAPSAPLARVSAAVISPDPMVSSLLWSKGLSTPPPTNPVPLPPAPVAMAEGASPPVSPDTAMPPLAAKISPPGQRVEGAIPVTPPPAARTVSEPRLDRLLPSTPAPAEAVTLIHATVAPAPAQHALVQPASAPPNPVLPASPLPVTNPGPEGRPAAPALTDAPATGAPALRPATAAPLNAPFTRPMTARASVTEPTALPLLRPDSGAADPANPDGAPPDTPRTDLARVDPARPDAPRGGSSPMPPVARQIAEALPPADGPGFDLALNPEELGHVRLRLVSLEGGSLLMIQAERPETLDLMRRNIGSLEQELRDLGHEGLQLQFSSGGGDGRAHRHAVWADTASAPALASATPPPEGRTPPARPQPVAGRGPLDLRL